MKKEAVKKQAWHALEKAKVLDTLETEADYGLSSDEAKERLQKFGSNKIPSAPKRSWYMRLLLQFHNVLIYVLLVAAVITALMEHWIDTWVIMAVILINAIIGFIQEGKAEKALEGIRAMLSPEAMILRDGKKKLLDAAEIVPGDVVLLKSGDKVPADVRLVEAKDFQVEESPLTGESTAVQKKVEAVDESAVIGDQLSMAFSGTVVVYGSAKGVVVRTGLKTELGRINEMMSSVESITTPLLQQIENFGKWLSLVIVLGTAAFFGFGYFFRDYGLAELFLAAIGLVVASIPEGLPAIMTITLAIGVQRMASRNAIIRRLPSVETLGAVNVICTDKTGTLTKNEMTAKTLVTADKIFEVEGSGYAPEGQILHDGKAVDLGKEQVLKQMLRTAKACNNAEIEKEDGKWKLTGPPTEGALLTLSHKGGLQEFKPERIDHVPFESEHKYAATLNKVEDEVMVFITGAPDRLLGFCSKQYTAEGAEDLDAAFWEKSMENLAANGQRMLGLAFGKTDSSRQSIDKAYCEKDKIFLGVVGIIDPPRDEVYDAIQECKDAGVQVKMITGDHVITAKAIGKQIGIGDGEKALTGKELEEMSDEALQKVVGEYDIYARTSPEHKLRLVKALQANDKLVAMTGDGVNDAPALKKANIGIAMGIKGTEVTKDASEMVLADDNFATIVNAIEEGRTVYDNIRKALLFLLPTNGAEAIVLIAAILMGMVMPITPTQILWVNMVTAVTLALALSFEPMESSVMERSPRKKGDSILGGLFVWRIAFVSVVIGAFTLGVFTYLSNSGFDDAFVRTVAVNTLVAGKFFYLFNCRQIESPAIGKRFFTNPYAFVAAGILLLLQLGFVYLPFMNAFFETTAMGLSFWLYPVVSGVLVFIIVEIEKAVMSKLAQKGQKRREP